MYDPTVVVKISHIGPTWQKEGDEPPLALNCAEDSKCGLTAGQRGADDVAGYVSGRSGRPDMVNMGRMLLHAVMVDEFGFGRP